jgi:hypothetical protein
MKESRWKLAESWLNLHPESSLDERSQARDHFTLAAAASKPPAALRHREISSSSDESWLNLHPESSFEFES